MYVESYASMNMWGITPEFMQILEDGFKEFFANMGNKDIMKAEYLLPIYIDELLQAGRVSVKVLDTNDKYGQLSLVSPCEQLAIIRRIKCILLNITLYLFTGKSIR